MYDIDLSGSGSPLASRMRPEGVWADKAARGFRRLYGPAGGLGGLGESAVYGTKIGEMGVTQCPPGYDTIPIGGDQVCCPAGLEARPLSTPGRYGCYATAATPLPDWATPKPASASAAAASVSGIRIPTWGWALIGVGVAGAVVGGVFYYRYRKSQASDFGAFAEGKKRPRKRAESVSDLRARRKLSLTAEYPSSYYTPLISERLPTMEEQEDYMYRRELARRWSGE
jgi:hypothetical protein